TTQKMKTQMKLVVTLITFVAVLAGNAQTCLPGGITLSSQSQIDNFATNYPGCTEILGNLIIDEESSGNILNLNGLSHIEKIGGSLRIEFNSGLTSISGLNNLIEIGQSLVIQQNGITLIDGLNNLEIVNSSVIILNNPSLTEISGFQNINHIIDDLNFQANPLLNTISGFVELEDIGRDLWIQQTSLLNLTFLSSLNSINR